VGQELVGYVSSIFKYYVAYTLVQQQAEAREKAKGEAGGAKGT
jgi:hypothetical protein